jgi:arylsulfatase A-like enzyme
VNGGIVFTNHFGTSSFANGSMASLLTGVGPMQHGVSDGDARLPKSVTTLAEAARQGGIRAGFFTANPTTGPDFGFQREWDTFRWLPPRDDAPATTVFDEAIRFIEEHAQDRWLTVIHTRGAHPPWDVTAEARKALPPENYLGPIDPKHGAEFVVSRSRRSGAKLSDADQTRLLALENNSILLEDAALGRLLDALATKHLTDNTAILITSDVAPLHGQSVPYAETPPTDAQALLLPLMVRLPKSLGLSQRTDTLTSTVDLAPTILRLLGMDSPPQFEGTALFSPAVHTQALLGRPALAVGGERFVLRLGPFALFGPSGRDSRLCDMNLEPACVADVSSTHPIALEVLRRALFDARHRDGKTPTREPATISPETAAALRAWGR